MKRRTFITTVIVVNMAFLLLHIHKHNMLTELSYTKQRYEKELSQLSKQEQHLQQELCNLQDRKTVTRYAQKYLGMNPISLQQIKKIETHA